MRFATTSRDCGATTVTAGAGGPLPTKEAVASSDGRPKAVAAPWEGVVGNVVARSGVREPEMCIMGVRGTVGLLENDAAGTAGASAAVGEPWVRAAAAAAPISHWITNSARSVGGKQSHQLQEHPTFAKRVTGKPR